MNSREMQIERASRAQLKVIAVSATALTSGGGLSILKQFLAHIPLYASRAHFYLFVSDKLDLKVLNNSLKNVEIIPIGFRSFAGRIAWDSWGLKQWFKHRKIVPDMLFSMQNTSIRYAGVSQLIYLHQGLVLYQKHWSFLKKEERRLAFYRYVYKWFVFAYAKRAEFIVQTDWMKQALCDQFSYDDRFVHVIKPNLIPIGIDSITKKQLPEMYSLFYPANGEVYKNHRILFDALFRLKQSSAAEHFSDIGLYVTFNPSQELVSLLTSWGILSQVHFLGVLYPEQVLQYYKSCSVVVFPSLIESFGLPLLEGAMFGKPMVVSDLPYAREVLADYSNVIYADSKDACVWSDSIARSFLLKDTHPFVPCYSKHWEHLFRLLLE